MSSAFVGGLFGSVIGVISVFIGIFLKERVAQAVHKRNVAAVLESYLDSYLHRLHNGPLVLAYATEWQEKIKAAEKNNNIADIQQRYSELLKRFEEGFMQTDAVREITESLANWDAWERRRILEDIRMAIDTINQDRLFPGDRDIAVMPSPYVKTFIQFKLSLCSFLKSADSLLHYYRL